MDAATADFYRRYARALTASSEASRSAMLPHVERALPPGASVLDVGAGSGRDVAALIDGGFDAFGAEPSVEMLEKALHLRPSLQGRLVRAMLPGLGRPFSERVPQGFDAVVCSAVLMHLEPADLPRAIESMVRQLRARRREDIDATSPALLLSLPYIEPAGLTGQRDADGRLFHNVDPDRVRDLLGTLGMALERTSDSDAVLAATQTHWKTLVFRSRP